MLLMTTNIIILNIDHQSHWLPLWQGYLEFYESTLASDVTYKTFARLSDPLEFDMGGYIAFDGDEAVGIVHYIVHRTCWSDKDICYLQDLFVAPNYRKGGIGRALIEEVASFARDHDLLKVYWQTQTNNKTARRLYDNIAQDSGFMVYKMDI